MTDAKTTNTPKRGDFRFIHRLRVRWAEVDMQKVVFNAHYLTYFDTAAADYWRAMALPYEEAMQQLGGDLFVRKATVEFHASAHMDDRLEVGLRCVRVGNSSLQFEGAIFRGPQLLITCELLYVFAETVTQTSRPVPAPLRSILSGYEAGEPMVELRTGGWDTLAEAAARIRRRVFVQEQGIAESQEWDAADATAVHAVAFNRLGQPLATGRLLQPQPGLAQIGRMAVHEALRGTGVAQAVMRALAQAAVQRGDTELLLHAQRSAENFYARMGFVPQGEPFDEVGIAHVEMHSALPLRPAG
jgi:YbgC/YbaW family acyl-CoA thioester hydrolase